MNLYRLLPTAAIAVLLAGVGGGIALGASLQPLATDCSKSALPPHDGFQNAPRCVPTAFGEVAAQAKDPQLLIVDAPKHVKVGEAFTIKVSTRNLIRDRFLAAGQGGYYLETSLLDANGLTRGHFHTSCRMLDDTEEAPEPDRAGDGLFVATEDGGGGAEPDTVTVSFPKGMPSKGTAQCVAWAGDGSHRIPMNQFANMIPAVDSVRIKVQ